MMRAAPWTTRSCAVVGFVAILAGTASPAVAQSSQWRPKAIVAGRYVTEDGTIGREQTIVLAGGKIQASIPGARPQEGGNVAHFPDAVVCPGLIDVRSSAGAYGNTVESAFSIDPGVSAIDSLDPGHRDFRLAVESGITTALIAPAPTNLVAGSCVVAKTGGPASARAGVVLRQDGPLVFGFGPATWRFDREPTSRIGAMAMLRSMLAGAKNGSQHARLRSFASGKLDGLVYCDQAMDVSAALRLFGDLSSNVVIVHNSDVHDLAEELAGANASIIVGPYSFSMTPRTLAMAGVLAKAGVEVAFAGQMPIEGGHSLRQTASLAVRYGMDPAKARRAMTINAAKAAGVSDRVGAIRAGMDADLVLFSGDPLRMDSRVLAVYIEGVRVFSADQQPTGGAKGKR